MIRSMRDTDRDFVVRLSWAEDNSVQAIKNPIGTTSPMSLGGWRNDKNNNKGWAVFEWTPSLKSCKNTKKPYYFYVEIDPDNVLDEVHEERHKGNTQAISDYGGNNTGFYPFYVFNQGENPDVIQTSGTFRAAAEKATITNTSFTDADGQLIPSVVDYLKEHENEQFVTLTANFTYNGPEVAYAFLDGDILTSAGHANFPDASLNNVTLIETLPYWYVAGTFAFQDFALFNGPNSVTFTLSPSDVVASADTAMLGVIYLTPEDIAEAEEYLGEDPSFTLEEIPDNIVASATDKTYTLTANEEVFWKISSVRLSGATATPEEEDDRLYLYIDLVTASKDEAAPSDYGRTATITVSSIVGHTPRGDYAITVQKSSDGGDEWTDAGTLKFTAADSSPRTGSNGNTSEDDASSSSSSGCNAGMRFLALSLVLSVLILRRKAL